MNRYINANGNQRMEYAMMMMNELFFLFVVVLMHHVRYCTNMT